MDPFRIRALSAGVTLMHDCCHQFSAPLPPRAVNASGSNVMKPERQLQGIPRKIVSFHLDERLEWVASLECGHRQYVRHEPPWTDRHWVTTFEGRMAHIGLELNCLACPPTEAVRRAWVRQLFEARHPQQRTETEVFLFFSWLQRFHSELLPTERGDPYQHLKVDLSGVY